MRFLYSPIFIISLIVEAFGTYYYGFSNWANVIQHLSYFGMVYGLWHYITVHRRDINQLEEHILHLHRKHDKLRRELERKE